MTRPEGPAQAAHAASVPSGDGGEDPTKAPPTVIAPAMAATVTNRVARLRRASIRAEPNPPSSARQAPPTHLLRRRGLPARLGSLGPAWCSRPHFGRDDLLRRIKRHLEPHLRLGGERLAGLDPDLIKPSAEAPELLGAETCQGPGVAARLDADDEVGEIGAERGAKGLEDQLPRITLVNPSAAASFRLRRTLLAGVSAPAYYRD